MRATQSEKVQLTLLYDQTVATPSSGTIANIGEETAAEIALLKNEVAEIVYVEITPAINTTTGATENTEEISLIIDGKPWYKDTVRLRADNDSLLCPPRVNINGQNLGFLEGQTKQFRLGYGLPEILENGVQPKHVLWNTTPKVREAGKINVEYKQGNATATGTLRVKMYGYKYTDLSVADYYMKAVYGRPVVVPLPDMQTGRKFQTTIMPNSLDVKDWTKLIGGNDQNLQSQVKVSPLVVWSRNNTATTASVEYPLSYAIGNAINPENNMSWEIDDRTLYYITHLGLRPHANHLELRAYANGVRTFRDRIRNSINNFNFGRVTSTGATVTAADHLYRPLPEIRPLFGHNETLEVRLLDSGTAIADGTNFGAGDLVVAKGLVIEDPSMQSDTPRMFGK